MSTVPDSSDVDISGVLQLDSRARLGSGLPLRGGGMWPIVVLLWSEGRLLCS